VYIGGRGNNPLHTSAAPSSYFSFSSSAFATSPTSVEFFDTVLPFLLLPPPPPAMPDQSEDACLLVMSHVVVHAFLVIDTMADAVVVVRRGATIARHRLRDARTTADANSREDDGRSMLATNDASDLTFAITSRYNSTGSSATNLPPPLLFAVPSSSSVAIAPPVSSREVGSTDDPTFVVFPPELLAVVVPDDDENDDVIRSHSIRTSRINSESYRNASSLARQGIWIYNIRMDVCIIVSRRVTRVFFFFFSAKR
jgi:hypothetical protein